MFANIFPDQGTIKKQFSAKRGSRMSTCSTQPWPEDTPSVVSILDRILTRLELLEQINQHLLDLISISQCDPIDIDHGPWQESELWEDDERQAQLHRSQ